MKKAELLLIVERNLTRILAQALSCWVGFLGSCMQTVLPQSKKVWSIPRDLVLRSKWRREYVRVEVFRGSTLPQASFAQLGHNNFKLPYNFISQAGKSSLTGKTQLPYRTKSHQSNTFICPNQHQPNNSQSVGLLSKLIVILLFYIAMSKFDSTSIYYHVPEDTDNPDQPNLFTVPVHKNNIKLQHIFQYFPLKGTYIFRFKFSHDGFVVWLDLADWEMKLPTFKEKIHVKASRVSWDEPNYQFPKNHHNKNKVEVKQAKKEVNLFDHPQQPQRVKVQPQIEINLQPNLLGFSSSSNTSGNLNLLGDFGGATKYQKSDFTHKPGNDKHDLI